MKFVDKCRANGNSKSAPRGRYSLKQRRSMLNVEELKAIMCELVAMVNDNALTYFGQGPEEPRLIRGANFLREDLLHLTLRLCVIKAGAY